MEGGIPRGSVRGFIVGGGAEALDGPRAGSVGDGGLTYHIYIQTEFRLAL